MKVRIFVNSVEIEIKRVGSTNISDTKATVEFTCSGVNADNVLLNWLSNNGFKQFSKSVYEVDVPDK